MASFWILPLSLVLQVFAPVARVWKVERLVWGILCQSGWAASFLSRFVTVLVFIVVSETVMSCRFAFGNHKAEAVWSEELRTNLYAGTETPCVCYHVLVVSLCFVECIMKMRSQGALSCSPWLYLSLCMKWPAKSLVYTMRLILPIRIYCERWGSEAHSFFSAVCTELASCLVQCSQNSASQLEQTFFGRFSSLLTTSKISVLEWLGIGNEGTHDQDSRLKSTPGPLSLF